MMKVPEIMLDNSLQKTDWLYTTYKDIFTDEKYFESISEFLN